MRLYHGTSARLRDVIGREGLRGYGRPVFLAEKEGVARRYARARAARDHQLGGESVGLMIIFDIAPDDLEPDPYEVVREPGQHLLRRDVLPAELVELREIRWRWGMVSWEKADAIAFWASLERAREDALDVWRAPESMAEVLDMANRDLARLRSSGPKSEI
jgi:hypothetical protein